MRREKNINKKNNFKIYAAGLVSIAILLIIVMLYYNLSKPSDSRIYTDKIAQINNQIENNTQGSTTEQASVNIGKSVEESEKEAEVEKIAINTSLIEKEENKEKQENKEMSKQAVEEKAIDKTEKEKKEELAFCMPVEGEIVKEFAKDTLLYSATLNEWTTHLGIDIKASKTTVVKASEKGIVKSIKNDPRYGLTIVIEHSDGYSTIYSNLLTSEFVVEGETVEKGQTIGTVGNTAVFEIADENHLHFEILKDNSQVDPNVYLK